MSTAEAMTMGETEAIEDVRIDEILSDGDSTEEPSATDAATTLTTPSDPLNINRTELQRWLTDYGVAITDEDLRDLTEPQAEVLWDWMESHVHQDEDESGHREWLGRIPDSVILDEPNGDGLVLKLVRQEVAVVEETTPSDPPAATATEITHTEKHLRLIQEAGEHARVLRERLNEAESDVRAAKGREKECRENLDRAEIELNRIIDDSRSGQQRLPFGDSDGPSGEKALYVNGAKTEVPGGDVAGFIVKDAVKALSSATSFPISELSIKAMSKLVGDDEMQRQKDQEDPLGLTSSQLEKLQESYDMKTVEDLEKMIREDAFWHKSLNGFGEKGIQRIVSTLVAFRRVNPIPAVE